MAITKISTALISDNSVGIAQLSGIARGKIIYGDASGNPALLAVGTNTYVLKSDGTDISWAADAGLSTEEVQDIAGAMFSSNTETGITATYQDADGTIDLVVGTLNQSTTGSAATLTTTRAIAVAGNVTGTANFDGSAAISITTTLADDVVTLAKMAAGTDGNIISYDATGNPVAIATGTDGQVLTSTGAGSPPAFEDAAGGGVTFKEGGANFTNSVMVGDSTTGTLSSADRNIGLGVDIFAALTSGTDNVAIGYTTLDANTTGIHNVAVGNYALTANTSGQLNTAIGHESMMASTTTVGNVGVGRRTLYSTTTGNNNTALGYLAMYLNTTGAQCTAVGTGALQNSTTAAYNTAVGYAALQANTTGTYNTALGYNAGFSNTTGANNIAIGKEALYTNTTTSNNIAIGYESLLSNTGTENLAIGLLSGRYQTGNNYNTFLGSRAGYATTSSENVMIGAYGGSSNTSSYHHVLIGYNVQSNSATGSNTENVIGHAVTGIGSGYNTLGGNANRTYNQQGSASWSGTSDERLKTNVVDEPIGLDFINDLRPVKFKWKKKKDVDSSTFPTIYEEGSEERVQLSEHGVDKHGFLAQELESTIANYSDLGDAGHEIFKETNDGIYTASPTALIPMLVKALQEADDKIDALVARVTTLEG